MKQLKQTSKIIFAVILALNLIFLCSCGGNMTEETVKAELERLLPLSYELNEIFWGEGLPTQDIESSDRYLPVTQDCGYSTAEEILDKAAQVYSEEYLAIIKDAIFTDSEDIDPRYLDVNGVLKADTSNEGFDVQGNIVIESAVIKKQNRSMVIVSAEYEDGGKTELTLVLEDGKWFLNSPTY